MVAFTTLLAQVRACTLCQAHLPLGPRPVVQLDPRARILIVGQAPGRKVHESGVPFDDASGDRLRDWLGVTREEFYDPAKFAIVPMGLCYPGRGKSGDNPPRPECVPAWRIQLLAHLRKIELTLVLGQHAHAYHFTEKQSLTQRVSDWRSYWPQQIPMPHPSPRNNLWLRRNPWFEAETVPALQRRVAALLGKTDSKARSEEIR